MHLKADRRTDLILELLDQLFSDPEANLPLFSRIAGSHLLVLGEVGSHQELDNRSVDRLLDAVRTLDTRLIRKEFENNLPGLLEKCLEFYLSRGDVRNSLGYTRFAQPNPDLPYWVGPNEELIR
jgi:hypothetical protein